MAVSKIVFGTEVLIDLTNDTVNPNKLLKGVKAHDASGVEVIGVVDITQQTYYAGYGAPSSSLGSDGDIYIDILEG